MNFSALLGLVNLNFSVLQIFLEQPLKILRNFIYSEEKLPILFTLLKSKEV